MWFLSVGSGNSVLGPNVSMGRITTAGSITQYAIPNTWYYIQPVGLTAGPDGALWFTLANETFPGGAVGVGGIIGRVSTSGSVTEFPLPEGISPGPIAAGPDGALWFIAYSAACSHTFSGCTSMIDRITTAGAVTNQFSVPVVGTSIATGPDGALWFFSSSTSMGRLTTDGTFTQYPLPAPQLLLLFKRPRAGTRRWPRRRLLGVRERNSGRPSTHTDALHHRGSSQ